MADILLIVVPIIMLWNSTLPKGPRWMIRIVSATSIAATGCGVAHAVYILGTNRLMEGHTAQFEVRRHIFVLPLQFD